MFPRDALLQPAAADEPSKRPPQVPKARRRWARSSCKRIRDSLRRLLQKLRSAWPPKFCLPEQRKLDIIPQLKP